MLWCFPFTLERLSAKCYRTVFVRVWSNGVPLAAFGPCEMCYVATGRTHEAGLWSLCFPGDVNHEMDAGSQTWFEAVHLLRWRPTIVAIALLLKAVEGVWTACMGQLNMQEHQNDSSVSCKNPSASAGGCQCTVPLSMQRSPPTTGRRPPLACHSLIRLTILEVNSLTQPSKLPASVSQEVSTDVLDCIS